MDFQVSVPVGLRRESATIKRTCAIASIEQVWIRIEIDVT